MSSEQREAEVAAVALVAFRALLDAEITLKKYKAGSAFDQHRSAFMQAALALQGQAARQEAAQVLRASYKFTDWPGKAARKLEVKQGLTQLDGQP